MTDAPLSVEESYRILAEATSVKASRARGPSANASAEVGTFIFVFPIVGSAPGANGTFFRSETTLVNGLDRTQRVVLFFFPAAGGNCSIQGIPLTLQSYGWAVWPDFVANVFGQSGLGGAAVVAVTSTGSVDTSAYIDGFSRIWTPAGGGSRGTSSQSFAPVLLNTYGGAMYSFGLKQNADFRTNIGIFTYAPNGGNQPRTFDVEIQGFNGEVQATTVNVPACGLGFLSAPNVAFGDNIFVTIKPRDNFGSWYGFASSNDNASNDNWSSPARP